MWGRSIFKKSLGNTLVGISMPAIKKVEDFTAKPQKINNELKKIDSMPLLTIEPYSSECKPVLEQILTDINSIEKSLFDISNYVDNTAEDFKSYDCQLTFDEITIQELNEESKIKNYISGVDLQLTTAKLITTPTLYNNLLDTLLLMES
jgi:hypothetical protein